MATNLKNLSEFSSEIPSAKDMSFGIVVSQWNLDITSKLLEGAIDTLTKAGCLRENITVKWVPGAFEIPLAVQYFADLTTVDGVVALGCVIQGETRHFDFICGPVSQSILNIQLAEGLPVGFGLLTTNDMQQALDRAGGKHGNKGDEAAATAIMMVSLGRSMNGEALRFIDKGAVN
ncbi:MAG: 6,7-dimethyl-8-ribityllumazine synthase [Rikenellaceae bacterium]